MAGRNWTRKSIEELVDGFIRRNAVKPEPISSYNVPTSHTLHGNKSKIRVDEIVSIIANGNVPSTPINSLKDNDDNVDTRHPIYYEWELLSTPFSIGVIVTLNGVFSNTLVNLLDGYTATGAKMTSYNLENFYYYINSTNTVYYLTKATDIKYDYLTLDGGVFIQQNIYVNTQTTSSEYRVLGFNKDNIVVSRLDSKIKLIGESSDTLIMTTYALTDDEIREMFDSATTVIHETF